MKISQNLGRFGNYLRQIQKLNDKLEKAMEGSNESGRTDRQLVSGFVLEAIALCEDCKEFSQQIYAGAVPHHYSEMDNLLFEESNITLERLYKLTGRTL